MRVDAEDQLLKSLVMEQVDITQINYNILKKISVLPNLMDLTVFNVKNIYLDYESYGLDSSEWERGCPPLMRGSNLLQLFWG